MNVFLCVVTSIQDPKYGKGQMPAQERIRKQYPPCYADTSFTIFRCNDSLSVVGEVVGKICDEYGVGAIVAPVMISGLYTHKVDASKCFGDVNRYSQSYIAR